MLVGTLFLLMLFTDARCMRITSRNGSRLMYQPGQAPPGMVGAVPGALASLRCANETSVTPRAMPAPRFVSARFFFVASVAGVNGGHCSAMRELFKKGLPHMMGRAEAG